MVAAPTVIAARTVARERAAKIACCKRRHAARKIQLLHGALESEHALTDFSQQICVRPESALTRARCLPGVQVVTTNLAEENLAFHSEATQGSASITCLNQA